MRRRSYLAGIGALSAGCLGSPPPRTNDTPSDRTNTTESDDETATRTCNGERETQAAETAEETATNGEYRLTNLTETTTTDGPSVNYTLETSAVYSGDAVEREEERTGEERVVQNVSEIENDEIRSSIETAIRSGEWRSNSLPEGLAETVQRVDFFTGVSRDETATHIGLTLHRNRPDRPPAVEFSATIVDGIVSQESPGVIELELTNRSENTQMVFSGTVPPFGMVFAESTDGDDEFLLWRDYEEEGCIVFTDDGWTRCDIGALTEIQPCESITRRYEVLSSETSHQPEYTMPPGPGGYRITDSLTYNQERGAPSTELSFEVQFSLEAVE